MIDSFKKFQAQTTNYPLGIEVTKAEGSYVYSRKKKYLDLVAGVSVQNLGHCNQELNKSIKNQIEKYSHVMVYGEFIQKPSLELCELFIFYFSVFFVHCYIVMKFYYYTSC